MGEPSQPSLYLIVGLPGAGKTTRAREIETEHAALRLTADDWIASLYGYDLDTAQSINVRALVEQLQWQVARRTLGLGCNVVLDWGLWTREERDGYRTQADAIGARVEIVFLDAPVDVLWSRITLWAESAHGTLQVTRADLDAWAMWFEPPSAEEMA